MDRYLHIFVGKNADYYISKWEVMEATGSKISWNWAAFFFGMLWFAYRKMYSIAIMIMAFLILLQIIQLKMNTPPLIVALTNIFISIGFGMFGNYIYLDFVKNKIKEIKEKYPDENLIIAEIGRNGGTSIISAIMFGLIYLILTGFIDYYFTEVLN
ncbi:hypothetical protein JCM14244_12780 [Venenivibrio stagnispumantis]|uniref:DUF2628 domain-containing protein n=1 Tax=Venenivibrio stagnispumantis TaxID=407998 RepID=A0AA46AEX1_9AQUI|nr:DUF2628 domain-containing protein [Venenivibrio stagnispumantis]MCW4573776.1 DUF2628 domain-containing protein [Venenivibrio stagnispumantis]SMP14836.1 Protein of unknown function [Venenivibrio stagnispumantis]